MKNIGLNCELQGSKSELRAPASLRGFWCLFVTQFQGAFSDNVLKNLVVFMILGAGVSLPKEHQFGEHVTALFSLPFILFSMAVASWPTGSANGPSWL